MGRMLASQTAFYMLSEKNNKQLSLTIISRLLNSARGVRFG